MRTLVFGAGLLGFLYMHLLNNVGKDVIILARGQEYDWIKAMAFVLMNELRGSELDPE